MPQSPEQIRTNETDDAKQISDMVIYLAPAQPGMLGHFYSCKNLSATGDCSVYGTRPAMCREFPYDGKQCPFKGCTRKAIEMEEHPTPWSMKLEGGEYVIRNANNGEVSPHKKKAEAMAAFAAGKAADPPGEMVQIPPEGAATVSGETTGPAATPPADDSPEKAPAGKSRRRGNQRK